MRPMDRTQRFALLKNLDIGSSAAESDSRLLEVRIETDIFGELVRDELDVIRGIKGSGKTALFRIFTESLADKFYTEDRIIIIPGVETSGDPVFNAQKPILSKMAEEEILDFWKIWIIVLVNSELFKNDYFKKLLKQASPVISKFDRVCTNCNLPTFDQKKTHKELSEALIRLLPKVVKLGISTPDGFGYSGEITGPLFGKEEPKPKGGPIYVKEMLELIRRVLEDCDLKLWIMLDRLDEAFPRRSELEEKALRALLKAYKDVSSPRLRIKIFIRDDIFDLVTKGPEGFTALSHIQARTSRTLAWTDKELAYLAVKRIFSDEMLKEFYSVDSLSLGKDPNYRLRLFYEVFPNRMGKSKSAQGTLDWIYNRCMDGLRAVTPRDVIELLRNARFSELDRLNSGSVNDIDPLFGIRALKYGYEQLSRVKKETYLQAEFPKLWRYIEKFEGQKAEHDTKSLRMLFGPEAKEIAEKLCSIGVLGKHIGKEIYVIPFLFRPGLNIKQGKAYKE